MDDVGVLAALHGGADDVLEVLVGDELDLDTGGLGEGRADVDPHLSAVGGLDGGYLDGAGGFGGVAAFGSSGVGAGSGGIAGGGLGRAARGQNAESEHEHENERKEFLHCHSSFLKFWFCKYIPYGWQFHPSDVLSIIFPAYYSIK